MCDKIPSRVVKRQAWGYYDVQQTSRKHGVKSEYPLQGNLLMEGTGVRRATKIWGEVERCTSEDESMLIGTRVYDVY
jgi:hypothetical protein